MHLLKIPRPSSSYSLSSASTVLTPPSPIEPSSSSTPHDQECTGQCIIHGHSQDRRLHVPPPAPAKSQQPQYFNLQPLALQKQDLEPPFTTITQTSLGSEESNYTNQITGATLSTATPPTTVSRPRVYQHARQSSHETLKFRKPIKEPHSSLPISSMRSNIVRRFTASPDVPTKTTGLASLSETVECGSVTAPESTASSIIFTPDTSTTSKAPTNLSQGMTLAASTANPTDVALAFAPPKGYSESMATEDSKLLEACEEKEKIQSIKPPSEIILTEASKQQEHVPLGSKLREFVNPPKTWKRRAALQKHIVEEDVEDELECITVPEVR
ncbi:unnamed protein product [Protopolystoma xenopodis]|uniref:Uncharacterized protein n=1 Tax=Protopolystoma xenopodis TaxID=117903 RepID=A0A3S5BA11_9PLAT|nr:unnamed protein product [Protopolystoma xenopodis]